MSGIPRKTSASSQLLFASSEIVATPATTAQLEGERATDEIPPRNNVTVLRPIARRPATPIGPRPQYVSHGPFRMTKDGLTIEAKGGEGKEPKASPAPVSGPFEIIGVSRNSAGSEWGLWLQWQDRDGRTHRRLVAAASLHGDTGMLCQSLAREGLFIESQKHRELARYLNGVNVARRVTIVDRTGWHEIGERQVFVLPNETIGPSGGETVILEGAATAPYGTRGSLHDWRVGVATLASGHYLPVLAISAALAGPLVHLAGAEGGGLHFFGASSKGKTTILQAAASVWGRGGTPGFVKAWRATANGLEGAAALASDTVLILDEMGVVDARDAAAAIYGLANGAGKQRAAQDGSLREPKSWRVIVISSGEIPLEAKLSEGKAKARAGQLIRVLDVPSDRGTGFGVFDHGGESGDAGALSRAIKDGAVESYGLAGPEFVRLIIENEIAGSVVRGMVGDFLRSECPQEADGQCERAAYRLGVIGAAGELATSLGVTSWQTGEARAAAAWAFKQWLSNRGGTEPAEERQAVAQVRLFFEQYGEARFDPLDSPEARPSSNRAGWRKGDGKEREWLIPPEIWKVEICAGLNPAFVAQTLHLRGMLEKAKDGYQPVRRIGGESKRVYVVNSLIFAGRDEENGGADSRFLARGEPSLKVA